MILSRPILFAAAFAVAVLLPLAAPAEVPVAEDGAYATGTRAMNESRWNDAVAAFDQVVESKSGKADAALYWKAYSLGKLNKPQLAAETCRQLGVQHRASPWIKDCTALRLSMAQWQREANSNDPYRFDFRMDSNGGGATQIPDLEIRLLALNSLAQRDPAQAMPILRGVLTSNQPAELKQHALFVLAQSHSPEAGAMMHDLVMGKQGPVLQRQAIQSSGIYLGKRGNETLAEAYRTTTDTPIKRAVISAFFISGDDARMVELARTEKDIELRRNIVSQLSLMQGKAANDYMLELLK